MKLIATTITAEELVNHIEKETMKAVDYGTEVGLSLIAFVALASLVGMF